MFVNNLNIVKTILCLTKNPIDFHRYQHIWGKHLTVLGHLGARFKAGLVSNLFDYFDQSWMYAIFHDRFDDMQERIYCIMAKQVNTIMVYVRIITNFILKIIAEYIFRGIR